MESVENRRVVCHDCDHFDDCHLHLHHLTCNTAAQAGGLMQL